MISFREALGKLLEMVPRMGTEEVRIENAAGRVLRQTILADRDFPPFDRVMMDGFALRSAEWTDGTRVFKVTGQAMAGLPQVGFPEEAGTCVEVMTGAPCPAGADCVVPVEELAGMEEGGARFRDGAAPVAGKFIHARGSDVAAGTVLLQEGALLGAREIGVAASCGVGSLEVSRVPVISVVATGDELVGVDETPLPHQIRQSNAHAVATALARAGFPAANVGTVCDDEEVAVAVLAERLAAGDWLILTGAVSKGARDFVPVVLAELGCTELFHGVAQRPGKPAGCWIGPKGQIVMALPGNPVSAITGLHAFVLPALGRAVGLEEKSGRRVVPVDCRGLEGMTQHLPVVLREDGRVEAAPTGNSGDFVGLLKSDGFVTLPPRGEHAGLPVAVPFTPWL
ncbi:molybdopterin molybdotransferase MoeA [Luteolibacter sp. SL250]|uniref:molybdopterin molybdotransferase MoeA n=1 Tax=Luteolibacter sp. SL250 TaxID=2995170 RepID=UPI00226E4A13|nr:molybdopterin molybdotransferase MoeA [Luteolibacter sp. SL250]WAC18073.1 molybdopterin molybdotransferase MoeA [Luteolibacter sp. SL250]